MYFSEHFNIELTDDDDWFDPLLEIDTQLFVDPFLIYKEGSGIWIDSGDKLADHFQKGFELLATNHRNPESLAYRKTVDLMKFPEPREFGLGYASSGTSGSGAGSILANLIVEAMSEAITREVYDLRHFEELGFLVDGIGKDRISDIACNILKDKFIAYTQEICISHGIPTEVFSVTNGSFDDNRNRWTNKNALLPRNPHTGDYILLTPARFLRKLPTLNVDDWWDHLDPTLLVDFNLDMLGRLKKSQIISIAKRNTNAVRAWTLSMESTSPTPYDVRTDPDGLHNFQLITKGFSANHPLQLTQVNVNNFHEFIAAITEKFKQNVEQEGGWKVLWNERSIKPKNEVNIQLLYNAIVKQYCDLYQVSVLREVELGRGPVDFMFVGNNNIKVILEVKKMRSNKFWQGFDVQLTSYLTSSGCNMGWYLAVRFSDSEVEQERTRDLPSHTQELVAQTGFDLKSQWIDARRKESASIITQGNEGVIHEAVEDPEFDNSNEE